MPFLAPAQRLAPIPRSATYSLFRDETIGVRREPWGFLSYPKRNRLELSDSHPFIWQLVNNAVTIGPQGEPFTNLTLDWYVFEYYVAQMDARVAVPPLMDL